MYAISLYILTIILRSTFSTHDTEYKPTHKGNLWDISHVKQLRSQKFWYDDAQETLKKKLQQHHNTNTAKNVIFFIGDGMSVSTVTAARIYEGQLRGIVGERNKLAFEKFPYHGLSKTYCVDRQVADSACTASAYLCGIKANYMTIGVTANVSHNACDASREPQNRLRSIAGWAQDAGKATGIVTTTRITHASPAGAYAHTCNRDFECDRDIHKILQGLQTADECVDIARQLLENDIAKRFQVILGGGSTKFLPNTTQDSQGNRGERWDGRNLIYEWASDKADKVAKFISQRDQLMNTKVDETDYLLGLFSPSHMAYNLDNVQTQHPQPSLMEMTDVAIRMLQKNERGYFLFVEGGRIDHAHHDTMATKALDETVQFSRAVQHAYAITDPQDTLIVVSADHSHTLTINGYPHINNNITGLASELSSIDGLPYATLSYANGATFEDFYTASGENVERVDLRKMFENADSNLKFPSGVPMVEETHGGGDVSIYASGPWQHIFSGVMEQNSLPHFMAFASCIGPGLHACNY